MSAIAAITALAALTWDRVPLRLGAAFLTGAITGVGVRGDGDIGRRTR